MYVRMYAILLSARHKRINGAASCADGALYAVVQTTRAYAQRRHVRMAVSASRNGTRSAATATSRRSPDPPAMTVCSVDIYTVNLRGC